MTSPLPLARGTVDRCEDKREDETWLSAAWQDPGTRVLVVQDGRALVDSAGHLVLLPPAEAPAGPRFLLGVEAGRAYFSVPAALPDPAGDGERAAGLAEVGATLDDREAGLLVQAVALEFWHARHTHCPRCGSVTHLGRAGYVRRCPADGSEHFPRVDPAVIMLVRDPHDRCLLARKPIWPRLRHSVLAGFVEPGESLEQAVGREVSEEVGLRVTTVTYMASQPWPFPSSLMLAFVATATHTEFAVDGDEICAARWFTRTELERATRAGEVLLPPASSIARRLIESWHGGELTGS